MYANEELKNHFRPLWTLLKGRGQKVDEEISFYMVRLQDDERARLRELMELYPDVKSCVDRIEGYIVRFRAVDAVRTAAKPYLEGPKKWR